MELPKLPKHKTMFLNTIYKGGESTFEYYTAEQMQEYARQAVLMEREACAFTCTTLPVLEVNGNEALAYFLAIEYCVKAIRART